MLVGGKRRWRRTSGRPAHVCSPFCTLVLPYAIIACKARGARVEASIHLHPPYVRRFLRPPSAAFPKSAGARRVAPLTLPP